jgi:iron complex outermembrane receptor protein
LALPLIPLPILAQEDPGNEPIYELSPFEVSSADQSGYLAQTSVSGTALNTPLRDIPISLRVITEDFMDDTFATDLESAVAYAAGVTQDGETREGGSFNIRGFRVVRAKRDGLTSLYSQDMTNVSRVEVVKGPNSILYGETVPGGIINYITKKPMNEPFHRIDLSIGSYGYRRAQVETTGPLIRADGRPVLLYRLDVSYEEEDGWRKYKDGDKTFISPMVEWRPFPRTSLSFQYEFTNKNGRQVDGHYLYSSKAKEEWENSDEALKAASAFSFFNFRDMPYDSITDFGDYEFTSASTDNFNNFDGDLYVLNVEQSLWDNRITVRFNATWVRPVLEIKTQQMNTLLFKAAAGQNVFANRTLFRNAEDSYQLRIAANWEVKGIQNRTLLGAEWIESEFRGWIFDDINPPFYLFIPDLASFPPQYIPNQPITQNEPTPISDQTSNVDFRDRESYAFYGTNLTTLLNGKLKFLMGLRFDHQEQRIVDRGIDSPVEEELIPQAGIIYSPTEAWNFYASYSESFVPKRELGNKFDPDNPRTPIKFPLDPLIGEGKEIGVKVDLLDSRISGSFAFFDITYENFVRGERISYIDEGGTERFFVETRQDVEATSKGFDLDLVLTPIDNWQLVVGYAYIKTDNGIGTDDSFEDSKGIPRNQFSLWNKYTVEDGVLENLSIGFGALYRDQIRLLDPDAIRIDPDLRDDAYWSFDAMLAYEYEAGNIQYNFQFNAKNLFDKQYYQPNLIPGDPRELIFSVGITF